MKRDAQETEDSLALLDPSESDAAEADLPKTRLLTKKRIFAGMMCIALLGAAFAASHSQGAIPSGTSLRGGNVEKTIKLTTTSSSWFLIKHDVLDDATFKKKMMGYVSSKTMQAEYMRNTTALGFYNQAFLQTGPTGPYYCLWEGAPGKTEADMVEFMNNSMLSPKHMLAPMINTVMAIPSGLLLLGPPVTPYFGGNLSTNATARRLQATGPSSFYLTEHEFISDATKTSWWSAMRTLTSNQTAMASYVAAIADLGFHTTFCLPTSEAGPAYCLWEAQSGKTKADMTNFINSDPISPSMITGSPSLNNTVMALNTSLSGGQIMVVDLIQHGNFFK